MLSDEDEKALAAARNEYERENRMDPAFEEMLSGRDTISTAIALGVLAWKIGYLPCNNKENPLERYYDVLSGQDPNTFSETMRRAFSAARENRVTEAIGLVNDAIGVKARGRPRLASAFLALCEPKSYAVLDRQAWFALCGGTRDDFDVQDYRDYLAVLREMARELGWTARQVDTALYQLGSKRKRLSHEYLEDSHR